MKNMFLGFMLLSMGLILFYKIGISKAYAADNVRCTGDTARVCANVMEPNGNWRTLVGSKGIITGIEMID